MRAANLSTTAFADAPATPLEPVDAPATPPAPATPSVPAPVRIAPRADKEKKRGDLVRAESGGVAPDEPSRGYIHFVIV